MLCTICYSNDGITASSPNDIIKHAIIFKCIEITRAYVTCIDMSRIS